MTSDNALDRIQAIRAEADRRLHNMRPVDGRYVWEPDYGFTMIDRVALAAALEAVRRRVCAYGGYGRCDCKYGAGRTAIWALLHPDDLLDDPRGHA